MDFLEIFEKYNDNKEINDCINDIKKLRYYYQNCEYYKMQNHISIIINKHFNKAVEWNTVNHEMPVTFEQKYINAENFLKVYGATIIINNIYNYTPKELML